MPWSAPSEKDQKLLFVADCLREEESMTVLCERYGISRETGYVLKRRFLAEGSSGLEERSRAPLRHGHATAAELVVRLIEAVNRGGISVLLVEQNLHQSLHIAHRGYVLEKGAVVLAGTGKELLADAYVQRAFLGR